MMVSMILHTTRMDLFVGGEGEVALTGYFGVSLRKKNLSTRDRAFGSLRYEASEWTQSFISLAVKRILALG